MKTEIKIESGRVYLIYRGEDYGSYPVKIISFEKKDTSTLLIRICESVLTPEKMSNVLANDVQLTEDNFKELLFDNLTQSGSGSTPSLTATPMYKEDFDNSNSNEDDPNKDSYFELNVEGVNLTTDIVINVSSVDYQTAGASEQPGWDNRAGGLAHVYIMDADTSAGGIMEVTSIDAETATINIKVRTPS
jgi:hypothetical protein